MSAAARERERDQTTRCVESKTTMNLIPHSRPWITEADERALAALLRSGRLATGATRDAFEEAFARWIGVKEPGVAVGSGAAALQVALVALGITAGDEVVLPSYASRRLLHAVQAVGATAVPCDVGQSWIVTPECIAPLMSARTRAIVVPHVYGIFARTAAFKIFGVPVVEDISEAVAGDGAHVLQGDIAVASFHETMCLTTGEGGMAIAARADLAARLRAVRDGAGRLQPAQGPRLFSPMSDLAAALGLSQLGRYHEALVLRRQLAFRYRACLEPLVPEVMGRQPIEDTMHLRFPISVAGGLDQWEPRFARQGVEVRRGITALLHRDLGLSDEHCPRAVELFATTVSLPIYPSLSDPDFRRCADAALDVCTTPAAPLATGAR